MYNVLMDRNSGDLDEATNALLVDYQQLFSRFPNQKRRPTLDSSDRASILIFVMF